MLELVERHNPTIKSSTIHEDCICLPPSVAEAVSFDPALEIKVKHHRLFYNSLGLPINSKLKPRDPS